MPSPYIGLAAYAAPRVGEALYSIFNRPKPFDPLEYYRTGYRRLERKQFGKIDTNPITARIARSYDAAQNASLGQLSRSLAVTGSSENNVARLFAPGKLAYDTNIAKGEAQAQVQQAALQEQQNRILGALNAGLPSAEANARQPSTASAVLGTLAKVGGAVGGQALTMKSLTDFLKTPEADALEPRIKSLLLLLAQGVIS